MKMIMIFCREKLERDVLQLLNSQGVKGYTVMSGLGGKGLTGVVSEHGLIERNVGFLVVLDDTQATALAEAVKQLYKTLLERQGGEEVPIKAFVLPCDVIV